MRKFYTLGLAFAAIFAFCAVAATAAFAESEWLANGQPITSELAGDSEGTLELEDMHTGVAVLCTGTDKGTFGPGKADKETEIPAQPCTTLKGECGSAKAAAVNLPWSTEIVLVGTEFRDNITTANAGYKVECNTFIGKVTDTCEGASSTLLTNEAGGVVDSLFDEKSPATKCKSPLGEGEGLVHGLVTLLLTSGEPLTVS